MPTPLEYLEAATAAEVARQLEADGYTVARDQRVDGAFYDLIATKQDQRIAVEVKARPRLRGAGAHLRDLRERAYRQGFTEFRLVVANPPHETLVEIDGLNQQLFQHMAEHPPQEIDDLTPSTRITGISSIDFDSARITPDAIHLTGTGIVEVELEYAGGEASDGGSWETDFPFSFALTLDRDLTIASVDRLVVDISGFHE
jgi:Holliday junction resolvase-like predicted endonuclease